MTVVPDPYESTSSNDLLQQAMVDREAFGAFYDRHFDEVVQFFWRRTSDSHTAADLTAETFAQALLSLERFDVNGGGARQWLFGIARHQLFHYLRHLKVKTKALNRLGIQSIPLEDSPTERIETILDAQSQRETLDDALSELTPAIARAVHLRITEGRDFEEIAKELGCSPGAVRVRVSRGLSQLNARLAMETP